MAGLDVLAANLPAQAADWIVGPFTSSAVMQRALLAGTFAAVACGLVGTWVVLRGMTFLGDALAHGVLPGLALAAVVGFDPTIGALGSAAAMIAGISLIGRRSRLPEDVSIGLLFVGMLALGVLIISRSRSFAGELTAFLFGGITSIDQADLVLGAIVALVVTALAVVCYRPFLTLAFNRATATLAGFRPALTHGLLLAMITATVVASFTTVGTLLVFALITAPAAAAVQLVRRVPAALVLSVLLAELAVFAGLLLSWHARLAAGASMAICAVVIFALALIGSELRRWLIAHRAGPAADLAGPADRAA